MVGSAAGAIIRTRPLSVNSFSDSTFEFITKHVTDCIANHPLCNPQRLVNEHGCEWKEYYHFFPTRVLDVSPHGTDLPSIRLIEPKGNIKEQYAALSHCWGDSTHFTTTSTNLPDRLNIIPDADLPKTFADAVLITRKLGLRYLWIDSLCIVQNNAEDWARESAVMGQLYHNAFITISASAAPNDRDIGCLFDRREWITDLVAVPYWTSDERVDGHFYIHKRPPNYVKCQSESPLQERAWTLQERLLSPRTIQFTFRQVYFECVQERIGEDYAMLRMRDIAQSVKQMLFSRADGQNRNTARDIIPPQWIELIGQYSKRKLTYDKDILPALSGMVTHLQTMLDGGDYAAGLWKESIHHELCWITSSESTQRLAQPSWRAPTWSWASCKGGVTYGLAARYATLTEFNMPSLISDITTLVERATNDPNGQITSASLTFCGWLVKQRKWITDTNLSQESLPHGVSHELPRIHTIRNMIRRSGLDKRFQDGYASNDGLCQTRVIFDDPDEKPEEFVAVPIKSVEQGLMCDYEGPDQLRYWVTIAIILVAAESEGRSNIFRRVGLGYLIWPKDLDNRVHSRLTII